MKLFSDSTTRVLSKIRSNLLRKKFIKILLWIFVPICLVWISCVEISLNLQAFFRRHPDDWIMVGLPFDYYLTIRPKPKGMFMFLFASEPVISTSWGWIFLNSSTDCIPRKPPTTPDLVWQALLGHNTSVRSLLNKGVDVNAADTNGWTALLHVTRLGDAKSIEDILAVKPDVNKSAGDGRTSIMVASQFLQSHPPGYRTYAFKWRDEQGHFFVEVLPADPLPILESLIRAGADVNASDREGVTALMYAAHNRHTETVKLLIRHGANVNAKDKNNVSVLRYARGFFPQPKGVKKETNPLVDMLEKAGAMDNINLFSATMERDPVTVKALIESGANVNAVGPNRLTALMIAIKNDDVDMVRLLLDKGARLEPSHESEIRSLSNNREITELLLKFKTNK